MPARRKAVDFMKGLAKRSLAHRESATQSRNVNWLIFVCERQLLGLFDEISARRAFLR
jgi:hypothetical protein